MDDRQRPLVAGNWKMHGLRADGVARARALVARLAAEDVACEVAIMPPATLLHPLAEIVRGSALALGGQDCHPADDGAHTGDIAAPMLADAGCTYVIVGHSERRHHHGEDDALVRAKAEAAHRAGLTAVVCVGEDEDERDAGRALEVVSRQLRASLPAGVSALNTVVAYEPVWAIGTGRVPASGDIVAMHACLRAVLTEITTGPPPRILYGGSVKPVNAATILALDAVDGALVGGASLDADAFWAICRSCP